MGRARAFFLRLRTPAIVFVVCATVYSVTLWERAFTPSPDNHFVHQANSFLHGQLGVVGNVAPGDNDWARYDRRVAGERCGGDCVGQCDGQCSAQHGAGCFECSGACTGTCQTWYVSFPPFPALVILPAVAIWGTATLDRLFWAIFAGLAPALLYVLLRFLRESGKSTRSAREDLGLAFLYAFGTVYFFVAVQGAVWFAAHVVGASLLALYLLFALDARRPLLAGLVLALAVMTRVTMVTAVLVFAFEVLRVSRAEPEAELRGVGAWLGAVKWRDALRRYAVFAAPLVVIAGLAMWFNQARFESPLEFGHTFLQIRWVGRIEKWGLFNYHFFAKNLAVYTSALPWLSATSPYVKISRHGLALWFTTPNLLVALYPKRLSPTMRALFVSAALCAVWNLCYQNSGWIQFGYRFALDYLTLVFVLLALSGRRFGWGFWLAAVFALVVNTFGAVTFDRAWQFYDDDASQERIFQPD